MGDVRAGRIPRGWASMIMARARPAGLVLVAMAIGGCGSPSSASRAADPVNAVLPPNLITAADISAVPGVSPASATLQWFQAIQFQDVTSVRRLTSPAALQGVTDATLDSWLSVFGPAFVRPKITSVLTGRGTATVRMLLLDYKAGSRTPQSSRPFTLSLTRSGDGWLVNDIALLRTYATAFHLVYPNLIGHADVAATPKGSPSYVTLQWLQALQFQDAVSVRRLTTAAALQGISDARLRALVTRAGAAVGRPRILEVLTAAGKSLVRVLLLSYGATASVPSSSRALTLQLMRDRSSWRVSDLGLLRGLAGATTIR